MKKVLVLLTAVVLLFSCGKKSEFELKVKPSTTEVSGGLEGCYQVVDKEYKSAKDGMYNLLTIELKRTSQELPFDSDSDLYGYGTYGEGEGYRIGFGIEFLDKDGNVVKVVQPTAGGLEGVYSSEDVINLGKLDEDDSGVLRFSVDEDLKDAVSFRITSAYEEYEGSSSASSSDDDDDDEEISGNSSSVSSSDIDKILDDFEDMVDAYVKIVKKANNGDLSAMSDMATYLEKAESISNRLENVEGDMTAKQAARYAKIAQKMTRAIQ